MSVTPSSALAGEPVDDGLSRGAAVVRLVGLLVVLVGLAGLVLSSGLDAEAVRGFATDLGWLAPVAFVAAYVVLTVALVPGSVLTAAGGLLFGAAGGTALTLVGATAGATVAFSLARLVGRPSVERLAAGPVARVDEWLGHHGLGAVITLRLVPLVPFSAANWAAGVSGIGLRDFVVGTIVGIVPGTVAYAVIGARATDPTSPVFLAAVGGLLLLGVVGSVTLRHRRP